MAVEINKINYGNPTEEDIESTIESFLISLDEPKCNLNIVSDEAFPLWKKLWNNDQWKNYVEKAINSSIEVKIISHSPTINFLENVAYKHEDKDNLHIKYIEEHLTDCFLLADHQLYVNYNFNPKKNEMKFENILAKSPYSQTLEWFIKQFDKIWESATDEPKGILSILL